MSLPTTAQEIYDVLEADEALMAMLGTCLLKGAEEPIPALSVMWPNEEGEDGTTMEGVEVTIARSSSGDTRPFITGGEETSALFRLYVTQWTVLPTAGFNLDAVVRRVCQLLPGATWSDNSLPDGLGGLGQVAIQWLNPEIETRWED